MELLAEVGTDERDDGICLFHICFYFRPVSFDAGWIR
jgi:hypothetical protein